MFCGFVNAESSVSEDHYGDTNKVRSTEQAISNLRFFLFTFSLFIFIFDGLILMASGQHLKCHDAVPTNI